ncbi:YceH family protein [Peristeroidobacter soli]|jgi:uncharacterized protein YceH (UPF0502 family)|uniref:YceH family protein n=1 Tax=Peristeroidobacter soli TaxID=2497877 RepID=UPI00101B9440|nr:DUF480 domain-containing protein [Peristeroidobacter soli]
MNTHLSTLEARLIGCLIEKALTTPDQYPLSLNALLNACNQKSNREPVLSLDERTVQESVEGLVKKHLVLEKSGFGSRVQKYQHRFCNTGFGSFEFTPVQTAIICELLLRGPQTPGELRTRVPRMAELHNPAEVESALEDLATRPDGPFVKQLPRESGRRDSRYAHLFSGEDAIPLTPAEASGGGAEPQPNAPMAESRSSLTTRVDTLEAQVAALRQELEELRSSIKSS